MDIAGAAEHRKEHQTQLIEQPQFRTRTRQEAELTLPRFCKAGATPVPPPAWKHSTPGPASCSDSTSIFLTHTDLCNIPKLRTGQV